MLFNTLLFFIVEMFRLLSRTALAHIHSSRLCSTSVQEKIGELVKMNTVVVFMKGTPDQPMCGFSKAVIQILDMHEVARDKISTHNVLEEDALRQG